MNSINEFETFNKDSDALNLVNQNLLRLRGKLVDFAELKIFEACKRNAPTAKTLTEALSARMSNAPHYTTLNQVEFEIREIFKNEPIYVQAMKTSPYWDTNARDGNVALAAYAAAYEAAHNKHMEGKYLENRT